MNTLTLEIFKGKRGQQKGEWRWRLVASNGQIMADSSEGYVQKWKVRKAWNKIVKAVLAQKIKEVE